MKHSLSTLHHATSPAFPFLRHKASNLKMEEQADREAEEAMNEHVNASMDMTVVQEDSMDESQGTEDLQMTLQEAMALRKNLESKFEEELKPPPCLKSSIRDKIAHFEKKAKENRQGDENDVKKPPSTIVTTHSATAAKSSNTDRLKVFLRVRPCVAKEASTIEILSDGKAWPTTIRTYPPDSSNAAKTDRVRLKPDNPNDAHSIKEYEFTRVLGPGTSQTTVYEKTASPLVDGLCQGNSVGKSALLFCYGITNAGKTHTVMGDPRKQELWGIIPRCLSTALKKVEHTNLEVLFSSFEIYNEQLLDLLPQPSDNFGGFAASGASLKIREGPNGKMVIPGLTEYKVDSLKTGISLVRKAQASRHVAPNHLNRHSSRSHSISQITIRRSSEGKGNERIDTRCSLDESHLWIVDLAGNERSKRTNAGSLRQKEATYINMSLMNLMRCLTQTQKPYRDSKLTLLFMHHWSNPENTTTMIVNVHGAASDYDETQHVLSYAISSKSIPIVASKGVTSKQTKASEYDYDGRRKDGKHLTMVQRAAKMVRKLSPKRVLPTRKRKNQASTGQEKECVELSLSKKVRRGQLITDQGDESNNEPNFQQAREVSSLQLQLSIARSEIEALGSKNRELSHQLESAETSIRSEVAEEMLQEMMDMRRRYETTISKLKDSFIRFEDTQDEDVLTKAQSKIDELVEKVEECEEEMSRMARMHRSELNDMEEEHHASLLEKDKVIAELKRQLATYKSSTEDATTVSSLKTQLAASKAEIDQLKRSKEELIHNYEKLLAPDDEEEIEEEEEEMVVEEEEEEEEGEEEREGKEEKVGITQEEEKRGDENAQDRTAICVKDELEQENKEHDNPVSLESTMPMAEKVDLLRTSTTAENPPNQLLLSSSSEPEADTSLSCRGTAPPDRKPLANLSVNYAEEGSLSDSEDSFGPNKWLAPKRPTKMDPQTGLFPRPPGRAPKTAEGWDSRVGKWRVSIAN